MSEENIPVFEDARSAALGAPLSSGPAGEDVRDTPAFEELETEVRRIETEGPAAVRWDKVSRIGFDLLSTQGRDMLVAVWTTFGLTQTEKWRGLAVGVDGIYAMVTECWEHFAPTRERARVGALEWLVIRLTPIVADMAVEDEDIAAVIHASARLDELNILLPEKLTKERIAFGDLARAARPKAQEAKERLASAEKAKAEAAAKEVEAAAAAAAAAAAPEPASPPVAAAPPSPAPTAASPGGASVAPPPPQIGAGLTGAELNRAIGALTFSIYQHASRLREADLSDARSYRLSRTAIWLEIVEPPPAQGNVTPLPGPSAEWLQGIEMMQRSGEREVLVNEIENQINSSPFWLDAHRIVCEALNALGPRYAKAAETVIEMTVAFVRRLPALLDLSFANGTPYADPATRAWLDQHAAQPGDSTAGAAADSLGNLVGEVRDLVSAGKKAEALDKLGAARDAARGGRALFDLHMLQIQTCLDLDMPAVALPLMQHLDAEVERRSLDLWEPALALRAAGLALRAYRHPAAEKMLGDTGLRTAVEAAQRRLIQLDLRTAVRLVHA